MKKRVLSLLLTLVMMVGLLPNALAAKKPTFTDVSKDMWCFDYVEFVAEKGYFKGTTATTFNPNGTMTRQQFVTVLARMAGVKVDNSKSAFSDVPAGSYSAGSVAWAAKEGIVTGYADGTFHPTAPVTRQQMCAFMSRFMDYYAEANGVYFLKKAKVSSFADYNQVADYAKTSVDRCRAYGLIQGYAEDNTFRPAASATRAHVAAVIYRLALIIQKAAGGGGGGFIPTPNVTYTLTYTSNPLGTAVTKSADPVINNTGSASFVLEDISFVHAQASEYAGKVFLGWQDDVDPSVVYAAGATLVLPSSAPSKTLTASWVDENDLLYLAIRDSAADALGKAQSMTGAVDSKVPYANLTSLTANTPSTIDATDNSRTVTIGAEAELSTDIVSRLIETATYYAVDLIGTPSEFVTGSAADQAMQADAISKTEVEDIVKALLDVIDPNEIWWEGASRTEKIKNLASKVYDSLKEKAKVEGKPYAGMLWNTYYQYNGAALFTEVDLVDKNGTVVVTAKADKKLYDGSDVQLSYKEGVKRISKAVAQELYADLKTKTTYQTDLDVSGKLTLKFTMNTAQNINVITAAYPTTYHVAANLKLTQAGSEDYLAYKFVNGRPYVKLIVTAALQADYEQSVNALAEAAMTNAEAKKFLKDTVMGKLDAVVATMPELVAKIEAYGLATDGATYIKSKLSAGVDGWIDENLSTVPTTSGPYRPYDFFWNLDGKVDANGVIQATPGIDASRGLFINDDLTVAITDMVDDVIEAVLDDTYGIVLGTNETLNDGIVRVIDTKIAGGVNKTATQNDILTYTEGKIIDGLSGAGFVAPLVGDFFAQAFNCTVNTPAGGTPSVTGLTIDNIDAFLVASYPGTTSRDESMRQMQDYIGGQIDAKLTAAMNTVLTGEVATLIGGNADAINYLKNEVLTYLDFDAFADKRFPVADEDAVITALVNSVKASYGVDADTLNGKLESEIAKAAGAFSTYLNKIGAAKTFAGLTNVQLQNLVNVMKNETVLNKVSGKIAPKYVEAIAKAIGKIEGNPSEITINGVTVTGMATKVQAVKDASNARALCLAVADFLAQWGDLSIASFAEPGVEVDVVASAKGYTVSGGANFVIEVQ